jgi:hypothetical protein
MMATKKCIINFSSQYAYLSNKECVHVDDYTKLNENNIFYCEKEHELLYANGKKNTWESIVNIPFINETVLVDTPVGPYFQQYLDENRRNVSAAADVRNVLEEVQIEILKNSLMKLYLEDFYNLCERMGGDTAEQMCTLLRARADRGRFARLGRARRQSAPGRPLPRTRATR